MVLVTALGQVVEPHALVLHPVGGKRPDEVALRRLYTQYFGPELGQHRGTVAAGIALVTQVEDGDIVQGFGFSVGDSGVVALLYPVQKGGLLFKGHFAFLRWGSLAGKPRKVEWNL